MMRNNARLMAGLTLFCLTLTLPLTQVQAFPGFGGDDRNPSLTIHPTEIELDVPMPVNSANLALLFASRGEGSLSAIKDAEVRKYREHLEGELQSRLTRLFTDEEVPLVPREGMLSLRNSLDITVIKHLSKLQNKGDYELERGTVVVSGSFRYQLNDLNGRALRSRDLDLERFKLREKYQVKTLRDGSSAEDTTEEAIRAALSKMTEEVVDEIEDGLEADELRELLAG